MSSKEVKRKLQDTSIEGDDHQETDISHKNKVTPRSPTNTDSWAMEKILKEINEMRSEIKEGFVKTNEQSERMERELERNNRELERIGEELKRREEVWAKEKQEMMGRIQTLEDKFEKQEKTQKRNNIVIRNTDIGGEGIAKKVESFLKQNLDVEINVEEAYEVKQGIVIAKLESWNKKKSIMEKRNKLKGSKVYIDNDMTVKERKIQKELRDVGRHERQKGSVVKVMYQKININNEIYKWEQLKDTQISKN